MRLLTALSTALVTIGLATAASAADLPRAVHKAPAYAPPAMYNWTGPYLGLNLGYGWSDSSFGNADGVLGGAQIGYNWQGIGSPWVFGLEADIQAADMKASETAGGITATGKINGFGTIRGRIGYAWDRAMLYGTGGFAFTRTELSATNGVVSVSDKDWSTGWTLGAGFEYAFWNNWSAKIEYLYVDSGDVNVNLAGVPISGDYNFSVVRAGLNYRF